TSPRRRPPGRASLSILPELSQDRLQVGRLYEATVGLAQQVAGLAEGQSRSRGWAGDLCRQAAGAQLRGGGERLRQVRCALRPRLDRDREPLRHFNLREQLHQPLRREREARGRHRAFTTDLFHQRVVAATAAKRLAVQGELEDRAGVVFEVANERCRDKRLVIERFQRLRDDQQLPQRPGQLRDRRGQGGAEVVEISGALTL